MHAGLCTQVRERDIDARGAAASKCTCMEELDAFFDCCSEFADEEQLKHADSKFKDDLDNFFDSLEHATSSNSGAPVPPQTTKAPKIRLKPYRATYKNQQLQSMSLENISECLEKFKKQCQQQSCCRRECYTKLNEQMIVYCRSQYVLLPSFKERRAFLAEFQKRKPDGSHWNKFWLQKSDGEQVKVCRTVWLLAYGISEGTYK